MQRKEVASGRSTDRPLIQLGSARRHTRASTDETFPELVGDRTQRIGG